MKNYLHLNEIDSDLPLNSEVFRHSDGDGMASKRLRAIYYQGTRKVEEGHKPSHTAEPLIGYTACYLLYCFIIST